MEEVAINFYRIHECGYYYFRNGRFAFCDLGALLSDYSEWALRPGMTLESTSTYSPCEHGNYLRSFCYDIANINQDYIIGTWNEIPTNDGRIASLPARGNVGDAHVNFREVPEGNIPGYATYFWFIPNLNIYATLRFTNTLLNGNQNIIRALNGFLRLYSPHVESYEEDNGTIAIDGYKETPDSRVLNLRPSFKARPYRVMGDIDYVKNNCRSIQKIIRRKNLNLSNAVELDYWQKMLEFLGVSEPVAYGDITPVEYMVPYHPTRDEVNAMEIEWRESGMERWEDVGFKMRGEPNKIYWFSSSLVQFKTEIELTRDNDEIVDIESIARELSSHRDEILNVLPGI